MKEKVREFIGAFVADYERQDDIATSWGEPLVGFASADDSYIQSLPKLIRKGHGAPREVLDDASIIVAYFVPFTRELAKTNLTDTGLASPEWARAYEETNAMFKFLNEALITFLRTRGYDGGVSPKASTFYQDELVSDWSQRHFAYAAGLGTFGVNNMLITKRGCCGRYNTVVTNLDVEPDGQTEGEHCLYKKDGSCLICVKHCPIGALSAEKYNRHLCYELCKKNASIHTEFGSSYLDESGDGASGRGSEVCGKCVTQSPCAFWNLK